MFQCFLILRSKHGAKSVLQGWDGMGGNFSTRGVGVASRKEARIIEVLPGYKDKARESGE